MSKKTGDTQPMNEHPVKSFGTPPLLNEKFINKLQGAVKDARLRQSLQQKRVINPYDELNTD